MVTRISGLASGMDIDTMVKGLMDAQRVPLDKLYQKKIYTEWQRDDYRTINTALKEFGTLIADGIGRQSTFIQKTVTVSNPDVISVKNINSTTDFAGTIKNVTIATAATMASTGTTSVTSPTTDTIAVGQTIKIRAINKDGGFDKNADGSDKWFIHPITAGDTIQSVIDKINTDSGVTVFFDEGTKKFSITAKNTGNAGTTSATAAIQLNESLSGPGSFFTDVMKMDAALNSNTAAAATPESKGKNATLDYNGLTITRSSNTFIVNGAEITLKKDFNTSPVTFSSKADVDAIYKKVKEFVDSYNGLIANIQGKIDEKKNRDFSPLTDAQKKGMVADEVKLWEEKAKKGTLHNDSSLSSLLTNMRTSLYSSVSGTALDNLSNIGISTTKDYLSGGKLEIKEEKLRQAIADNPNAIYDLFMKSDGDDSKITAGDGLVKRLRGNLDTAMRDIGNKAGRTVSAVNNTFTLGRLLDDYKDKISAFEERMTAMENRYYKQFTAMEKAIQNANSQSASLSSYLAK